MSIQAIAWVLDNSVAEGMDRLVMLAIANHCDAEYSAWPSAERIAREARCDRATVFRSLKRLQQLGELEVVKGGGRSRTNTYRLIPSQRATVYEQESSDKPSQPATVRGSETVAACDPYDAETVAMGSLNRRNGADKPSHWCDTEPSVTKSSLSGRAQAPARAYAREADTATAKLPQPSIRESQPQVDAPRRPEPVEGRIPLPPKLDDETRKRGAAFFRALRTGEAPG